MTVLAGSDERIKLARAFNLLAYPLVLST